MNKEQYFVSEAGTQRPEIDKLSNIEIISNTSEIVKTFTSETNFYEGGDGSIELTSQDKTLNADIEQNIQRKSATEMQPGDSPIALNENPQPDNKEDYLMQSLIKIRDQAKKREASRKMGATVSKYGKVQSVVAKNKRITSSVAKLRSTLQPDWNESTILAQAAAPKPLQTPKSSSKVSLKPAVPKHLVNLGSLAKETFLESQQDRKNLTLLSPKHENFRSQIKTSKEQYKSPYKFSYRNSKANLSVANADILKSPTQDTLAVPKVNPIEPRNVSPTFKDRPKGSYLEMTKSRMGKLIDQGYLSSVKNQKIKKFSFALSPSKDANKFATQSSTKNMLSETALGSTTKKSKKNLEKTPDLKIGK